MPLTVLASLTLAIRMSWSVTSRFSAFLTTPGKLLPFTEQSCCKFWCQKIWPAIQISSTVEYWSTMPIVVLDTKGPLLAINSKWSFLLCDQVVWACIKSILKLYKYWIQCSVGVISSKTLHFDRNGLFSLTSSMISRKERPRNGPFSVHLLSLDCIDFCFGGRERIPTKWMNNRKEYGVLRWNGD